MRTFHPLTRAVQGPEEDFELPEDMDLDDGEGGAGDDRDDGPPEEAPKPDEMGGEIPDADAGEGQQPPDGRDQEAPAPGAISNTSLRSCARVGCAVMPRRLRQVECGISKQPSLLGRSCVTTCCGILHLLTRHVDPGRGGGRRRRRRP